MTTTTFDTSARIRAGRRILNIARLHTANTQTYLGIPWIITGVAFGFSAVIALIIHAVVPAGELEVALASMQYSWAMAAPLWYLVVVGVMAVATTFSFALGLSATRRDFFLGTAFTFLVVAVVNSIGYSVLYAIEQATNGFGIGMHHFTSMWLSGQQSVVEAFFTYFVAFFCVLALGAAFAAVWMRWKSAGVVTTFVGVAVLLLGIAAIIVLTRSTDAVLAWAGSLTLTQAFLIPLVVALIALALTWLVLRRAPARV